MTEVMSPPDLLHQLALEQLFELRSDQPPSVENRKDLLGWYKGSQRLKFLYGRTSNRVFVHPFNAPALNQALFNLEDEILLDLAFYYAAGQQEPGRLLLTSNRTADFFASLHPGISMSQNEFGRKKPSNKHFPYGVVAEGIENEKETVPVVCEYLVANQRSGHKPFEKFQMFEEQVQRFPEFFGESKLLFVVMRDSYPDIGTLAMNSSNILVSNIPTSYHDLQDFTRFVYTKYRPDRDEDMPTLSEIQAYVIEKSRSRTNNGSHR